MSGQHLGAFLLFLYCSAQSVAGHSFLVPLLQAKSLSQLRWTRLAAVKEYQRSGKLWPSVGHL